MVLHWTWCHLQNQTVAVHQRWILLLFHPSCLHTIYKGCSTKSNVRTWTCCFDDEFVFRSLDKCSITTFEPKSSKSWNFSRTYIKFLLKTWSSLVCIVLDMKSSKNKIVLSMMAYKSKESNPTYYEEDMHKHDSTEH